MKRTVLITCSILMATAALAQDDQPKTIALSDVERGLVERNNDFAFRLFRMARGGEDLILSPLSITYALGMMNNGAAGQTQQEINDVLGFGEAGADGINQFCRKMLQEAPTLDEETTTEIANTIFVNSSGDFELQQGFTEKARQYYDAVPTALNFYDDATIDVINQWANGHTHGMIPAIVDKDTFNPSAVSYLLNALYFKGLWSSKFDVANTCGEPFNGGATVPMMRRSAMSEYTGSDLYQAVRLPYGNGAYLMTLFLPREGKTIADVLATMDGHNWQFQGDGEYEVSLKMPRFKTSTGLDLKQLMQALGMPTAFNEYAAEFPYFGNASVYISKMFQKAVIELDEEGTKAAAVTIIENETTGIPRMASLHANRPFFYVISERSTGCIFFIGQYVGTDTAGLPRTGMGAAETGRHAVYDLQGRRVEAGWPSALKKGIYVIGGKKIVRH